jgi:hypothetical protein
MQRNGWTVRYEILTEVDIGYCLGCDAVWIGGYLPTIRRNLLPSSSRQKSKVSEETFSKTVKGGELWGQRENQLE